MAEDTARILIADALDEAAIRILEDAGLSVDTTTGLSEDELCDIIGDYRGLVVRSATHVTARVIQAGGSLQIVGRAGVGVDNIDQDAATRAGIVVENTPLGNITSAAEHAVALLFAASRNISRADRDMQAGRWNKKGCTGVELSGKKLGIVGLGKVGNIVASVAHSLDMDILVSDPYLTAGRASEMRVRKVDFEELLREADFVSVHTPLTEETRNMIGLKQLRMMKPTARLINAARGGILNESELAQALAEGVIAGAALDVYANEPLEDESPLRGLDAITLTPHLGASTEEAQTRVAENIAQQFVDFFTKGIIHNAVNVDVRLNPRIAPFAHLAETLGQMISSIVNHPIQKLEVGCYGPLVSENAEELSLMGLRGVLRQAAEEPITIVNAPLIARARGIDLIESKSERAANFSNLVTVAAETKCSHHIVAGTCFDGKDARIVQIDGFFVDVKPAEYLLVMFYPDQPGMVGRFGTLLGEADINIGNMAVGRQERRGQAAVVLTLDDPVPEDVLEKIRSSVPIERLHLLHLAV
ncbi:MAG: phosphoglycerate dehydrogenase [Lentisphaerae bacterium]|jgi:D-3-phosphoglycerate dehydrogenase / 2-oxoglutarate reductase|nr:phosphoglycerate dehydrogenase [Lentisphaerota bacterium]MBT5606140.1 phosphoglycerate dehydrogenase [Lentisphaerota bacterium]MBT7056359.1 phosphoglycerate dehydrogenase [Lentisphaerota bacterium]MBT7842965.1 phosphoglycerate dehydrogenase [Lentisphaerota bacterium]